MPRHNAVRVAIGYDQDPLSDSDNIEDITPSSGGQFNIPGVGSLYYALISDPDYSPGQPYIDGNGGFAYVGQAQSRYTQPMCHKDSLAYLRENYSGAVTASIRTSGTGYAGYNCRLRFEWQQRTDRSDWYTVTWIFTIVEAL